MHTCFHLQNVSDTMLANKPKMAFLLNFIGATVLGKIYIPHNYTEIGQYLLEKVVFICRHQADRHSHDMSQALTRVSHPNLVTHWIRDP